MKEHNAGGKGENKIPCSAVQTNKTGKVCECHQLKKQKTRREEDLFISRGTPHVFGNPEGPHSHPLYIRSFSKTKECKALGKA